jgi:hypothetical protein
MGRNTTFCRGLKFLQLLFKAANRRLALFRLHRRPLFTVPAPDFSVMKVGGRVQRGVRRALLLLREATTAELLRWCSREPGRTRRERKNRARMVWFVAMKMADRVGRVWPGGNVWRARNSEE